MTVPEGLIDTVNGLFGDPFSVRDRWSTRNGTFFRLTTSAARPDLVVKFGRNWTEADVQRLVEMNEQWSDALQHTPRISPTPIWPLPTYGAVCMPYVEGEDLHRAAKGGARLVNASRACGEAMAFYHRSARSPHKNLAESHLVNSARRIGIPPTHVDHLTPCIEPVHSTGDFAFHNIRRDTHGDLWIIDPEPDPPTVSIHRDIAWFLWWNWRLGGDDAQEQAFLRAYTAESRRDVEAPADRAVIDLYRCKFAAATARRKLGKLRTRQAVTHLRKAAELRLSLRGLDQLTGATT